MEICKTGCGQIGITALVGPENCGKSILLEGLRRSAVYLSGFRFVNLGSSVPPTAEIYDETEGSTDQQIARSAFLTAGFINALQDVPTGQPPLRHLVICGFPENDEHMSILLEACPGARLVLVDRKDDERNAIYGLAMKFDRQHSGQFVWVGASGKFYDRARHIVSRMAITSVERRSMGHQILDKRTEARKFLDGAKPEKVVPVLSRSLKTKSEPARPQQLFDVFAAMRPQAAC